MRLKEASEWLSTWYDISNKGLDNEALTVIQSVDGRFTASGHENGGVYIFNNDTGRLLHSLPGKNLRLGEE